MFRAPARMLARRGSLGGVVQGCRMKQVLPLIGTRGFAVSAMKSPQMMCYQCEQTTAGKGCTTTGVCFKTPELAGLQDLQVAYVKRLCQLAHAAGSTWSSLHEECAEVALETTFATLTNVNFDDSRFEGFLAKTAALIAKMEQTLGPASTPPSPPELPASLPSGDRKALFALASKCGVLARGSVVGDDDLFGVLEMATYGLKGTGAYLFHAEQVGKGTGAYTDEERQGVFQEFFRIGNYLASAASVPPTDAGAALNEALGESLAIGALNLRVMAMLDAAHRTVLGTPAPTPVPTKPSPSSHAILVSGHDLGTLRSLLEQIGEKDIDVYTHGEMMPAHGYPGLNKFRSLKGHYGTHWGEQYSEFRQFPGPILMTSNCLRPPTKKYSDRLFTAGPVGFQGIPHVAGDDFSSVIDRALTLPGFTDSGAQHPGPKAQLVAGFGHDAILGVADKVIEAVKAKQLNHIFVVGGCDGTETSRSYFTDLAKETPPDSVILTLGCGKFRLLDHDHGTIGGLPRLLDVGQCNDAYSAVVVAVKLAEALGCKVQDLPLHFAVSWFEQKAVAVLLTLLHLELKNIRIGPALPAFLTPKVLGVLGDKFGLKPIRAHAEDEDLAEMLQGQ